MVPADAPAERLAAVEAPYLLVTDADGRPLGWREQGSGDGRLLSYGRPFRPGVDSLRAALDCAVLSPTGWAVAVDADGKVTGVVSQQAIGEAVRAAHTEAEPDAAPGSEATRGEDEKVAG